MDHNHVVSPNTRGVLGTFIGCKVSGVFRYHDGAHHQVLVFDCGWGLVICGTGAIWTMKTEEVSHHLARCKYDLAQTQKELQGILSLAEEK